MSGNLDRERLRELVESNEIDTILVCFPDMQGRLLGKRVTGHYFLEHVIHEMHVCDYLLTVDMEMTPVPGYQAASWALGYGDLGVRPDLDTLRRIPWLPGTALVLGDCVDHNGNDLRHSPRAILKRQIERAAAAGYSAQMGSELEFYLFDETYESAAEKDYDSLKTSGRYIEDYHVLQTTKDEPFIGRPPWHRAGIGARAHLRRGCVRRGGDPRGAQDAAGGSGRAGRLDGVAGSLRR